VITKIAVGAILHKNQMTVYIKNLDVQTLGTFVRLKPEKDGISKFTIKFIKFS